MGNRLKLAVSIAIVGALFWSVNVGTSIRHLLTIDPLFVLGTLAAFLLSQLLEATKLRLLLTGRTLFELFAFTMLVQLYALVLPGQLAGEAVKAYRLCRGRSDPGAIVSAVVFDKVTSLIALMALTMAALVVESRRFGTGMMELAGLGLTALVAGTLVLAMEAPCRWLISTLHRVGQRWAWVARPLDSLERFLEVWRQSLRRPRIVALSLLLGTLVQLAAVAAAFLLALGLGIDLSFGMWCVIFGIMSVVVLVPVTVGGLGLREASLVGLLGTAGVPAEPALALALAIFAFKVVAALLGAALDVLVMRESPLAGVPPSGTLPSGTLSSGTLPEVPPSSRSLPG